MKNFGLSVDEEGVALVAFDVPDKSMNTLSDDVLSELPPLIARLEHDPAIVGAVLCSAKPSGFCAGGDLGDLGRKLGTPVAPVACPDTFRRLEILDKPIACALEGIALGGGLELALACHHRVAASSPRVKLGLPEVTVGLMPGAGGTQRLPRLIGLANALPLLLEGHSIDADEALRLGLVDQLEEAGRVVEAARRWVVANARAEAPWDRSDFRLPDDALPASVVSDTILLSTKAAIEQTYGSNYPAPVNILRAVEEGLKVDIDTGLAIEADCFARTASTAQAKAMVRTLFLSAQAVGKGTTRAARRPARIAVIGSGAEAAAMALVNARRRLVTVLIVPNRNAAAAIRRAIDQRIESEPESEQAILRNRISIEKTVSVSGVDLMIVIDCDSAAAALAARAALDDVATAALLATGQSGDAVRPPPLLNTAIGIRSPASFEQARAVEVVCGEHCSDQAIGAAVGYLLVLGKTPVVISGAHGDYLVRCGSTYLDEIRIMIADGVPPVSIERAAHLAGMRRPPLLSDKAPDLVSRGGRPSLTGIEPDVNGLRQRLLFRPCLEAARCLDEGVIDDPREADLAALSGFGFPAWTGGPLSYIDTIGVKEFVAQCDTLAARFGDRFAPPGVLRDMAVTATTIYSGW